jgi:hypothetical protein
MIEQQAHRLLQIFQPGQCIEWQGLTKEKHQPLIYSKGSRLKAVKNKGEA